MEHPEEKLVRLLRERGLTVTTAESCTGGMIAGRIVDVPGASWVLNQGLVTYSNEAKMRLLGVKEATLAAHGAVSSQTAEEMALGALASASADLALSSTGIAGPDGGTPEKPVGLVYLGCACRGKVYIKKNLFAGSRAEIREAAVNASIMLALSVLEGNV